ncbi:protein FAR1-RELATED SEQUENCE 9-like isoform X2 [Syzygium oleosum]|uniref:protein FAR1-RELATED SEQUENCE 9-like isoform X2 n=1 Tax=Syzygium oleosum TaxID=219896 RepID=UPI0024B9CBBF|nr:protein FAR1-RELATED SEQUENCE 9-like isoform X2 [Syzygium oleosum]
MRDNMEPEDASKEMAEECDDAHLHHSIHNLPKNFDFKVGMVFSSELKAYHTYVAYALRKGFGVRKGKKARNSKGEITRRTFLCNCEGFSCTPPDQQKKMERTENRCGCLAHIRFKVENGVHEVIEYMSEHNHAFLPENQRHLIRCGRMISDPSKGVLADMAKAGIVNFSSFNFLENEDGGSRNMGFSLRGSHNFLQTQRSSIVRGEDWQTLLNHFTCMQMQNPIFFYAVQIDQDGRLTNLFWRDSLSKFDYDCFGDVVMFDTTYRVSKYNMICAPFVGVNHHWRNTSFGCALLLDETVNSFIWLFETFLEAMGNRAPKTIFTDQDQAMEKAVEKVFLNAQHRVCTSHIAKHAAVNIPNLYEKPEFRDRYFSKLLYRCETESVFESTWKEMEEEWGTKDNSWLNRLYESRNKWSAVFARGIYSCGIGSTERSENTNNIFRLMPANSMNLIGFVHHYEQQVKYMREIEVRDDHNSRGKPKLLVSNNEILTHAALAYTHTIFSKFNEEFLQSMSERVLRCTSDGVVSEYTLVCHGVHGENVVRYDSANFSVSCGCKLFESNGWLCRHALYVLNGNIMVTKIPSAYVLKRWTKGAKDCNVDNDSPQVSPCSSKMSRYSTLMQKAFAIMNSGAEDENTMRIAMRNLDKTMEEILGHKSNLLTKDGEDNSDKVVNGNEVSYSVSETSISDHAPRKAKGVRGDGVEIESKKKQKKSSKGATSTAIQSRELVVSATLDEAHLPTHLSHSRQQSSFSPCNFGGPTTNPSLNNGMSEYRNTAYAGVLSQGSSNSYQYPGRNVANESEGTNMEGLQG